MDAGATPGTKIDRAGGVLPPARVAALQALAVLAYGLPGLADRLLYYRDEVRYGGIVSEMVARDAWLTQTIAGEPYLDKGPVYFMLLRAGAEMAGAVTPAALFAANLLTVWAFGLLSYAGLRLLGTPARRAELASLILLSLPLVAVYANTLRMDPLFGGVIFLSFALLARAVTAGAPRSRMALAGGLLSGLAVAIKGPFGLIFPFLGAAAVALADRQPLRLWRRDMALALAAAALPALLWFWALLAEFGVAALVNIVEVQLVERALHSVDGRKPWFTYLLYLPVVLLPWLVFAPALRWRDLRDDRAAWQGLLYALAALLVMQLVAQKSTKYLFPVLPPAALLLALALERAEAARPRLARLGFAVAAAGLAALAGALWIGAATGAGWTAEARELLPPGAIGGLAAMVLLAAAVLALAVPLATRWRPLPVVLASALALGGVKINLMPALDRLYDPGPVLRALDAARPAGAPVIVVGLYRGAASYHLTGPHRYVFGAEAAAAAIAGQDGPVGVVVYGAAPGALGPVLDGFRPVAEGLLENRPIRAYLREGI